MRFTRFTIWADSKSTVKQKNFSVVRGKLRTCYTSKMVIFCKNSLQFTVVNNFYKKLHFQISYVVLSLCWIFFSYLHLLYTFFLLLTFLNINGTSTLHTNVCLTTGMLQQCCHVVWGFCLTLSRSFHFFLVLLLLTLNFICLLWMLPYDISVRKTRKGLYLWQ